MYKKKFEKKFLPPLTCKYANSVRTSADCSIVDRDSELKFTGECESFPIEGAIFLRGDGHTLHD
jgi:hypothetical protein